MTKGKSKFTKGLASVLAILMVFFALPSRLVKADIQIDDTYVNHKKDIITLDLTNGSIRFTQCWINSYVINDTDSGSEVYHRFDPDDEIVIIQSGTSSTTNTILDDGTADPLNLTLKGVNIDVSGAGQGKAAARNDDLNIAKHCAFSLTNLNLQPDYSFELVNLTLQGSNTLKSGDFSAGLEVESHCSLTVQGSGSLTAIGGTGAAGIGGGSEVTGSADKYSRGCGTISLEGGTITANGGTAGTVPLDNGSNAEIFGGAGIGGGGGSDENGGNGGNIAIKQDAAVIASGGSGGAGIGGGSGFNGGSGGTVSITGGSVTATGSSAYVKIGSSGFFLRSAGIGGGGGINAGGSGGIIHIGGGIVNAKSSGMVIEHRPGAPSIYNNDFNYSGTISQKSGSYDIYSHYIPRCGYGFWAVPTSGGAASGIYQTSTDGAAIGSGGTVQNTILCSEDPSHTDSGSGGTITISGGTVTAESTETTADVLGGVSIGNSERPYYDLCQCSYHLEGTCTFNGGSVNTNLADNCAVTPAPTNGSNNVYKTATILPDIHQPTAVTATVGQQSFTAQTDAQGKLYCWLPETSSDTVLYNVKVDSTGMPYEAKGTVKTDGTSQLAVLRTGTALENLTFNGQKASLNSSGDYLLNVDRSTENITVGLCSACDLTSFKVTANQVSYGNGTDSVTVPLAGDNTDFAVHIVAKDGTQKDYTVHVVRPTIPPTISNNTGVTFDLTGANLPATVNSVSISSTLQASGSSVSSTVQGLIGQNQTLGNLSEFLIYDLKLLDQNGNPITNFTGKIKVKLPIPAGMSGNLKVLWFSPSNGTLTDMNATQENGFLVFETTHFSYYAIAQLAAPTAQPSNAAPISSNKVSGGSTPSITISSSTASKASSTTTSSNTTANASTGDNSTPLLPLALLGAGSAAGLVIVRKRTRYKLKKSSHRA